MLTVFRPRLEKPKAGNKFFIMIAFGGWSSAIKGSPTDPDCNVLANCVGYAYGRFNEIGNNTKMTWLAPRNAEKFYDIAIEQGLTISQTPMIGACAVWQKGETRNPDGKDGAGHVAIVEQVINDGEIITSESGYNCKTIWWTQTRKVGVDKNWGMGPDYKFLGFILNPVIDANTRIDTGSGGTTETPYLIRLEAGTPIYSIIGTVATQSSTIKSSTKYTIVDETVVGETKYGKLKSGAGWVVIGTVPAVTHPSTIKEGDTGDDVILLQKKLIELGFLCKDGADGDYGKITFGAVAGYQLKYGLKADGIAGPATITSLNIYPSK